MNPNFYMGNGCSNKHPLKIGCLGIQVGDIFLWNIEYIDVTIHGTENMDPKKVYFFVWFSLDHWIHMDE